MTAVLGAPLPHTLPETLPDTLPVAPHRPRVVVRAAPRREPRFDDELDEQAALTAPAGPSASGAGREQRLPFVAEKPPRAWAPGSSIRTGQPNPLPDPAAWGRRLVVGLIETSGGRRPLAQLGGMLSPSVNRGLGDTFERAARQGSAHWLHRASVRSVRAAEPVDGVAEVCATVETGQRVRALAFRLEECHGRWRCVRLQLG